MPSKGCKHIQKILDNVKSSGCKYFTTSRCIVISTEPFNYPIIFKIKIIYKYIKDE
jgi:hypothetical protein